MTPTTTPSAAETAFANLPVPSFTTDPQGKVTAWNLAAAALTGRAASEVVGQRAWKGFADRRMPLPLDEVLQSGESVQTDFTVTARDGNTSAVTFAAVPQLDAAGEPTSVVISLLPRASDRSAVNSDQAGQIAAIGRSQAVIEFELDGTILTANPNFLGALGYSLDEIVGRHHRMFVDPAVVASPAYAEFWSSLRQGTYSAGEYKRIGKGGKEVWIQASYNPILDGNGKPFKVVKYAADVTAQKLRFADFSGQISAIGKSQAVVEFAMDGTVLAANDLFCGALGYRLDEIVGKHHRMFVDPKFVGTAAYSDFWASLRQGRCDAGEYKRIANGGKEIWIQASYNPILDLNGKPFKVVKYATDITAQKLAAVEFSGQIAAIGKSQAVIEFAMDGTILTANDLFCGAVGYRLDEIVGKHHRIFVDPRYAATSAYSDFWANLRQGTFDAGEYKRIGKGGKEIWIQASYNPILDLNGRPFKVVKYATDVTEQKLKAADNGGQIAAIGKSQAVIEFGMDGAVLTANELFCAALGYRLEEIVGRHHRMFVEPLYAASAEYVEFWNNLRQGTYQAGEYKRIGRGGKEIWIQASYNPILDLNGKPFKVVKYATDITGRKMVLKDFEERLTMVSGGDLTAYVVDEYPGDFARLKDALNRTLDSLNDMLGQVHGSADQIAAGSSQVSSSAQALSSGASRQAAAIEEITASITDMTNQTRRNAENASQANQLAAAAGELATRGDDRMKAMVRAMGEIDEASQQISKIIKVIDEIAFQTNLLALNAAVEAARAGVHGKGFAVVAEEVRNLAARSASAAKETTAMIEGSLRRVSQGAGLAEETATALTRIVDGVGKVRDLVAEIAGASNEQARGIAQIDVGLKQVDQVTQQNTAGAEESASASEELSSQASRLRELLQQFKLREVGNKGSLAGIEITPELLAALQSFLARGGVGANRPPTQAAASSARGAPPKAAPKAASAAKVANGGHPARLIPLDDSEFGRY